MSAQFITLKKSDSSFKAYLEGSFSRNERAIPAQNLNVNTATEEVTFKIVPINSIATPAKVVLLFKLFRFEWLSLTMGPVLATWSYLLFIGQSLNKLDTGLALLAVVFFHSAVFAMNDYKDHIKGVDRISLNGGSQVIQKGWLSAKVVRQMGLILFIVGSSIGVYLILKQPFFLMAVAAFTAISVLGYSFYGQGLKYLGFGELIAFFCFGPMLTYGFSRAASQSHSWVVLLLGVGFGHLAALCMQSRQLENIISDAQIGVKSLAVRLGFDKSKKFIQLQILISPFLLLATFVYTEVHAISYFLLLPFTYFSLRLYLNLSSSASSLSSSMSNLRGQVSDLHIIFSTIVVISFWLVNIW